MDAGFQHLIVGLFSLDFHVVNDAALRFGIGQKILTHRGYCQRDNQTDAKQREHRAFDADSRSTDGHRFIVLCQSVHHEQAGQEHSNRRCKHDQIGQAQEVVYDGEIKGSSGLQ